LVFYFQRILLCIISSWALMSSWNHSLPNC